MWKSLNSYDVSLACHCVYEHRTAQSGLLRGKSWMLMCTLKERFGIAVLCEPILGVKGLGGLHEPRQ
jgi:hypothetical protein